jgi:hypothetical protein
MHSRVEHKPLPRSLEVITIRADLRAAGEINELHENDEARMSNDEGVMK